MRFILFLLLLSSCHPHIAQSVCDHVAGGCMKKAKVTARVLVVMGFEEVQYCEGDGLYVGVGHAWVRFKEDGYLKVTDPNGSVILDGDPPGFVVVLVHSLK